MAKRDQLRLNVVEVGKTGRPPNRPRPSLPPKHRVANAQEVLMALESSPGAGLLLEHVPLLGSHGAWNQVAYFDVHGWSGLATALTLWDADFDGFFNMQECLDNNFAVFTGASWDTEFGT